METNCLHIVEFRTEHQPIFERLNREWIEQYFWMEPIDTLVLQHPEEQILGKGGHILIACWEDEPVGVAALRPIDNTTFEFTKMAVDKKFRGRKIGLQLTEAAIQKAKDLGAKTVILYSSTKLIAAISLYRKLGFREIPVDPIYKRSDIKMKIDLV